MKFLGALSIAASLVQAYPRPSTSNRALYFLDSDPSGASIVSFPVAHDGSLGEPQRTSTGGLGQIGVGMNGSVAVDPLFSQGSVIVVGNSLFTVNAGSNTVAAFRIPEDDPTHPVLLGRPADTVGTVPNTVAYSPKNHALCVANTGPEPGVQCFRVSACSELEPFGNFKPLPVMNQTNPIMGAPNTVSNILFNPSETALFVVIKGNGMEDGFVYAYNIANGHISDEPVRSRPTNVPNAFGMSFVNESLAVIATPVYGAAFVSIADDLSVSLSANITIPNEAAPCWTVFSKERNSMYILDGGAANLTTLDPETQTMSSTVLGFQDGRGNFDGIIGGNKLYALQNSPAIAIFDLENRADGPDVVDLSSLGNRASWIGMAIY